MFSQFLNNNDTQETPVSAIGHDETYCSDLSCDCHTDVEYHEQVTGIPQHSDDVIRSAFHFLGLAW
jgi:hypothetical protein